MNRGATLVPAGATWWRNWRPAVAFAVASALVFAIGTFATSQAGTLGPLTTGTLYSDTSGTIPVTADVRDEFVTGSLPATLNGRVTELNDGSGTFTSGAGPTWIANGNWAVTRLAAPNGYVVYNAGTARRAALFPFLPTTGVGGKVSSSLRLTNVNASTDAGPMLFSTAAGINASPAGLYADIYQFNNGTQRTATFGIYNNGTSAFCGATSSPTWTTATTTFDLTLDYDPTVGSNNLTMTATPVGAGNPTYNYSCTVTPAQVPGNYAGLMSYTNSPARYTQILFSYP